MNRHKLYIYSLLPDTKSRCRVLLYENGNKGLVIGDNGTLVHQLFESEKISEGHYWKG